MDDRWKGHLEPIKKRDVVDPNGTMWRVTEAIARDVPGAQASKCLIFDSPRACHRLWRFPADWLGWSDGAIVGLMDRPRPGDSQTADIRA
ncbi:MAG: hypothetical protein M3081_22525 [Gemmatimonadota bacterium]|nr:hypothetical protein [Gemmatimonadota bacterium]